MNKLKIISIATLFAAGVSFAGEPCDGFEIKIKNNLTNSMLATTVKLFGGTVRPGSMRRIPAYTEQIFTIYNTSSSFLMKGEFSLHTLSIPSKKIKIYYSLNNDTDPAACTHADIQIVGDYPVNETKEEGMVTYTIG